MNKEKDIFDQNNKNDTDTLYQIPENYFNELNYKLENRIGNLQSKNTKIIILKNFIKIAAVFLLTIVSFSLLTNSINNDSINYDQLSISIDDYFNSEDELYYTFNHDEDKNYLKINENIDDYFETEIDLY